MNESTFLSHALDAAAEAAAAKDAAAKDAAAEDAAAEAATLAAEADAAADVAALLDCLLGAVERALAPRVCGVHVPAGEGRNLPVVALRGLADDALGDAGRLAEAATRWRAAHPVALSTPLAGEDGRDSLPALLAAAGCHSLISAPFEAREGPPGLAFVGLGDAHPGEQGVELLNLFARIGGLALGRLQTAERVEQQRRQSDAIYRVSLALTATLDLEHLLSLIVRLATDTAPRATNGVLHLLDERTGELHPRALSFVGEVRPDAPGRSQMRQGHGVAGVALERGQVINVPDVARDARFVRVGDVRPFASMLVAPLLLGERRIGTLSIDSPQTDAFTEADEHLLLTLATLAAAAIENARLVGDLQQSLADLKRTQEQLIQSEKLSAIGQLIAGVAHELNNPLTAIMGYAQLLQSDEELDEVVTRDLTKIHAQAQRAARIVQNLLTFARQQHFRREYLDMNDIIARTVELRAYQLRVSNVQVHQQLAAEPLGVLADTSQMQQVLLNLINNAHDAIKSCKAEGNITIASRLIDGMVQVRVSDDGPGLDAETRKHLFEPFYTTKEVGKGTGLGLSICFGIVSQHEGRIRAEGESGEGATFVIELPLASETEHHGRRAKTPQARTPRGRSVLLVEDDEEVASPLQRFLVEDGHHVALARDGQAALERIADLRRAGAPPDLVISDIKMPGLDGPALYEHLCQQSEGRPGRILFITGDTLSPDTAQFLERSGAPCLAKPFTVEELRRAIAGAFEAPDGVQAAPPAQW